MSYKFETHMHSRDASSCASVDADTIVSRYLEAGYSGGMLANHINIDVVLNLYGVPWKEKIDLYTGAYKKLQKAAEGKNFDAIFGAEVRFRASCNDYLVFGMTDKFLYENEAVFAAGIEEFHKAASENGMLVFQAHPFRVNMTVTNPEYLDGIEVYNGHVGHNSSNEIAEHWADLYGLRKSSGSDFHDDDQPITAGIVTEKRITDSGILIETLLSGKYELIKTPF